MRKLHVITGTLLALAISAHSHGQVSNPSIQTVASNPSGNACSAGVPMLYYAGTYYGCDGTGHYAAVGGSSVNFIDATSYGVKANGRIVQDASTTNTSPTITCPNSDCNFTSADVGKIVFATNMTTDVSGLTSTVIVARSTILTVNGAQSITVSNNASASTTAAATLIWGTLDSAASGATQSTANDPLFAAWTAAEQSCTPLQLPSGVMMVEQPEFITYTAGTPCASTNEQLSIRRGYMVKGYSPVHTIIVPTPSLDPTKCVGGTTQGGSGCFLSAPTLSFRDLSIFGGGNSALGAGYSGKQGVFLQGLSDGTNYFINNVNLWGWGSNTSGFVGVQSGSSAGLGGGISGLWITNAIIESFGIAEFWARTNTQMIDLENSAIAACGAWCVQVEAGRFFSVNNQYGYEPTTGTSAVTVEPGAYFYSTNDTWPWAVGTGAAEFACSGTASITNAWINASANFALEAGSGCNLSVSGSLLYSSLAGNGIKIDGGVVHDIGGNTISGITPSAGGSISSPSYALSTQTAITSGATIAPVTQAFHITAANAINTITVPGFCGASNPCQLTLIPDGAFTLGTSGNIAIASTAVVGKQMIVTYDPNTSKWYPSY